MQRLSFKALFFFVVFIAASVIFGAAFETAAPYAKTKLIVILSSRNVYPYNAAISGFKDALNDAGISPKVQEFDLDGSVEEGHRAIGTAGVDQPDLILAVGSIAAEVAFNEADEYPVVFTMVSNPEDGGYTAGLKGSKSNITGVAFDPPFKAQLELLKEMIPELAVVGIIYNPGETLKAIGELKAAAKSMGIEIVAIPITSKAKLPDALSFLYGKCGAILSVADSTVFAAKSIKYMISYTVKHKIPFMGISPRFVSEGALVCVSPDYSEVGRQAGEMAVKVLSGTLPSRLTVEHPRKLLISMNMRTAASIGLKLSPSVLAKADELIK